MDELLWAPKEQRRGFGNDSRRQGHRHGFFSGGTNRRQVANLYPKYPKNRKILYLCRFILESGGDVPLLNFSLEGTRSLRPQAFDAHGRRF